MTRIQRRRRIRCRMPCEVLGQGKQPLRASLVSLSEGGFAVEAPVRVEQGEPLRVRIRGPRPIAVEGIVWNDRPARRAHGGDRLRLLGCILSDPSADFVELMARLERRNAPPATPTRTSSRPAASRTAETDLPRSRDPLPPPKPPEKEALPRFRVRLKQAGGPRTCLLKVNASSVAEAQAQALVALGGASPASWEVLEVQKDPAKP